MIDVANVNRIQKGNMDTAMAKNSWSYKTIEKIYTEASILVTYLNYDLENWEMRAFLTSWGENTGFTALPKPIETWWIMFTCKRKAENT